MTDRRWAWRQRQEDAEEKRPVEVGKHEREDEAARKRGQLEVLRRVREVGYWWPDGS